MSRSQATDEERQAVWEMLLLHSNGGGIKSMGERVAAVVKSRKHARGRNKKDRGEPCKRLAEVAVNDRENQRAVQEGSGVSSYLVQQLIKE
ncbi:hypothetical protein F441_16528, partial [Phytophthora nicotianae CJ01A1]